MSAAGVMQSVGQLRGWWGLVAAYASVQVPMFVGLARGRAPFGKYIASPVVALPLTLVAAVGVAAAAPLWHGVSIATAATMAVSTGVALSATLGYAAGRYYTRRGPPAYVHRRGALLADPAPAVRSRHQLRARSLAHSHGTEASRIALAGVAVTPADEVKHFKLIGTTGTGKSTAIHELLRAALARGDRAVIADPDGGYVRRFYDPKRGDAILNPFDPASARWDLFGEINNDYDVEQLARSLIPDHEGSDRSWRGYARTFFSAVTAQAHAAGTRDVSELYRLLVVAGTPELKALVGGTPAQPFLEEHNGRMFDSIRSVTSSAVSSLAYISRQRSTPLAVRDWVRASAVAGEGASPHGRGALFMPYKAGQVAALRSTISAWMRLAIFEAMNRAEGDQRLWFVVDELDALGQIDGLKDALTRLRKFGGRCVLGFQSVAQVSSTYGSGEAQTIVENCGNTLILRCSGSEHGGTSRFASGLIGEREVMRTRVSRSRRPNESSPSVTHAEHTSVEPAVMTSEIEQLPDLAGYLKLASRREWLRVSLQPQHSSHGSPRAVAVARSARILPFFRGSHSRAVPTAHAGRGPASEHAQDGFDAGR